MRKKNSASLLISFSTNQSTMTAAEFARAFGSGESTARQWARNGLIDGVFKEPTSHKWCIPVEAVNTFKPPTIDHPTGPITFFPKKLHKARLKRTIEGLEKTCTRCGDSWPANGEFFRVVKRCDHYVLSSQCRECRNEVDRTRRLRKPKPNRLKPSVISRTRRGTRTLVVIRILGRVYAALYPLGSNTSEKAIQEDLKREGYGWWLTHKQRQGFKPYDPVTGKFLPRPAHWGRHGRHHLALQERAERHKASVDRSPWAAYRRRSDGPPPLPDYFPQRWQSPRLQKLAADIRARAETRRKKGGEQ